MTAPEPLQPISTDFAALYAGIVTPREVDDPPALVRMRRSLELCIYDARRQGVTVRAIRETFPALSASTVANWTRRVRDTMRSAERSDTAQPGGSAP